MQTKTLPCQLTEEEIRLRGLRLATLRSEIGDIEIEKKAANQEFKERIESREKQCGTLVKQITSGQEYREVIIEEVKDWESQSVRTIRVDTGETVEVRAMTPRELQRPIPFDRPITESEVQADLKDLEETA